MERIHKEIWRFDAEYFSRTKWISVYYCVPRKFIFFTFNLDKVKE